MAWLKHNIPLETCVSFEGDSQVYIVTDYQEMLYCNPCKAGHDEGECYEEPYITVRSETRAAFPLSKLKYVYGDDHIGRPYEP